jgi:single-strand DNA-binding protein
MARGLNKVMIIGFLERDQETRHTPNGQPVASFSLSTNRRWTTNAGQTRESTEWFNVVAWGELAETASQWLKKDQRIYAEGHLQTRKWDDADGQCHFRTEVVATRLIPMGDRKFLAEQPLPTDNGDVALCLNRVMVIGNVGRDPEMRYTPRGQAVTSFSLAATRHWTTANGDRRDATEWFNVVSWGSLAEICNQYLTKGRRVYVEGELRTRSWAEPDGQKRFCTELVASEMILLGPRPRAGRAEYNENSYSDDSPLQ